MTGESHFYDPLAVRQPKQSSAQLTHEGSAMHRNVKFMLFLAVCLVGVEVGNALSDQYVYNASCTGPQTQCGLGTWLFTDPYGTQYWCNITDNSQTGPTCKTDSGQSCRETQDGISCIVTCTGTRLDNQGDCWG